MEKKSVELTEQEKKMLALKARIEAANAKKASEEAKRVLSEEEELEKEALRAEKDAENEVKLNELVTKHGELGKKISAVYTAEGDMVVVKKADSITYKKYMELDKATTNDIEKLIKPCLIHPSTEKWNMLLNDFTSLIPDAGNAIARLGGFGIKAIEKK